MSYLGERPKMLVDMDNTSYDFDGRMARIVLDEYGIKVDLTEADRFYFAESFPIATDAYKEVVQRPDFFAEMYPYDGVVDAFKAYEEQGFEVAFCSSPLSQNPTCIEQKKIAIDRDFGPKYVDTAIFDRDKTRHYGTIIIDDKPLPATTNWLQVIYDQPYNRNSNYEFRMRGWQPGLEERYVALSAFYKTLDRDRDKVDV